MAEAAEDNIGLEGNGGIEAGFIAGQEQLDHVMLQQLLAGIYETVMAPGSSAWVASSPQPSTHTAGANVVPVMVAAQLDVSGAEPYPGTSPGYSNLAHAPANQGAEGAGLQLSLTQPLELPEKGQVVRRRTVGHGAVLAQPSAATSKHAPTAPTGASFMQRWLSELPDHADALGWDEAEPGGAAIGSKRTSPAAPVPPYIAPHVVHKYQAPPWQSLSARPEQGAAPGSKAAQAVQHLREGVTTAASGTDAAERAASHTVHSKHSKKEGKPFKRKKQFRPEDDYRRRQAQRNGAVMIEGVAQS